MNTKSSFQILSIFSFLLMLTSIDSLKAQDSSRTLLLSEAIANSIQNNQSVLLAQQDEKIATEKYRQTDALYLPQVALNYTAMSSNNPLNAFGFKLQEKSIGISDFNPDLLNHPKGTADFTTQLSVIQPLINVDGWYLKKAASKQTEIYQLQTQRSKEFIRFEVEKAYLQLGFAYDAVKVLTEALNTAQKINKFTKDHFEQGLIQQSDVLNTEVQIKSVETALARAKSNIKNASDYLSLLMHFPVGVIYRVQQTESTDTNKIDNNFNIERSDFLAMEKALQASDLAIQASKKSYLPRINAMGTYQLNDNRMMGFGANAYLAAIQLHWNIFDGNRTHHNIQVQQLERAKLKDQLTLQEDQSKLEWIKAMRDLNDANYEILQKDKAVDQAKEALRILQNRYQQGLTNTTDVLMASTQLSQQALERAQAKLTVSITQAYLQFLTAKQNN